MRRALIGDTSGYGGSYMTRGYGGPAPSALMESMALNDPARLALIPALKKMLGYTPEERARLDETLAAMNNLTMGQPGFRQALMNRFDALTDIHGPDLIGAGIINWHGGPNRWLPEPKFPKGRPRLDRIGSGEGHQAYGHGFYSADARAVAGDYKTRLTDRGGDTVVRGDAGEVKMPTWLANRVEKEGIDSAIKEWETRLAGMRKELPTAHQPWNLEGNINRMAKQLEEMRGIKGKIDIERGTLKKLDIPDADVAKYLDWDAPLSQQSDHVKAGLEKLASSESPLTGTYAKRIVVDKFKTPEWLEYEAQIRTAAASVDDAGKAVRIAREMVEGKRPRSGDYAHQHWRSLDKYAPDIDHNAIHNVADIPEMTGGELYRHLGEGEEAAAMLREVGIPGNKYYDQMSRGEGKGTRNYVTWDQDVLNRTEILEP